MTSALISPADYLVLGVPLSVLSIAILLTGLGAFGYIAAKRIRPLLDATPDKPLADIPARISNVFLVWLAQWRQPRYFAAGILHIAIFFGFLSLMIRTLSFVFIGIWPEFALPGFDGYVGAVYSVLKDYAATIVLIGCAAAAFRRGVLRPERYAVPAKYGKDHTGEAIFVLGVISVMMLSESLFDACLIAAAQHGGHFAPPGTLVWLWAMVLESASQPILQCLYIASYYIHDVVFFFFLCFLPFGKHFHVLTSIFNVFFMRVKTGNIKPVKYGIKDEELDDLESFGVKKLTDFTWKHMLDFYSCADCGRCSDHCPANAVGRPLSPRFISIKGRDLLFKEYPVMVTRTEKLRSYPVLGHKNEPKPLIGGTYLEDEIWSCTTCGACERECPLGIEYIDKIVDLRRGMVDEGMVPQSLQKPLKALEKRGNPWGKMERKRMDWAKNKEFAADCKVKSLEKGDTAETLYFVDSISSFDDRMQSLSQASAKILTAAGVDFGVLGKLEKDSGNEVKRFGEEMLFQTLKEENTEAILGSEARRIVTSDPHAYNALKNEYEGLPPLEHISETVEKSVNSGKIQFNPLEGGKVYTYHDPCYLGRHNKLYESPRNALDAIPGMNRVEMSKYADRSFCCGGGGLMLFYEPEEETRMGVLRVEMAREAGADVIVTACPFCLVNMEDAIKVAGMEGKIEAIDFTELVADQLKEQP